VEFAIIGIVTAFNILIILWKFNRGQNFNAFVDAALLVLVAIVFSGTYAALVVGSIASAIVSLWLCFVPLRGKKAMTASNETWEERLDRLLD